MNFRQITSPAGASGWLRAVLASLAALIVLSILPGSATAANEPPVVAREGSDSSPANPAINPARDLREAHFRVGMEDGVTTARIKLGAEPTAATTSDLMIVWGFMDGTTCQLMPGTDSILPTHETGAGEPGDGAYWRRTGSEFQTHVEFYSDWQDFDCAVAVTVPTDSFDLDPDLAYDSLVVVLKDVRAAPQGQLQAKVLGSVSAYAGSRASVRLKVSNPGTGPVTGARLKLSGKKLRAAKAIGDLAAGESRVVKLKPKAGRGKTKRRVEVIATGRGPAPISYRRKVTFEIRTKGRNPKPGRYVGNGGRVTFQVTRGGTVKRIRLRVVGVCNPGAYTWAEWKTLPKTKINRFGWVDRTYKRGKGVSWWAALLTARFVGGRVLEGDYRYVTSLCEAQVKFRARRVGP